MLLYLVNPANPGVSLVNTRASRLNAWRIWKPLGLLNLAALAPPTWDVKVIDENLGAPDYDALPRPDLVGITAFTSQAPRSYEVAAGYRARRIPVVMGGVHATVAPREAADHVDCVVTGEAEEVWPTVLADAARGGLGREYRGSPVDITRVPAALHRALPRGYRFGSVQTTRGCPLDCSFCSVSAINGRRYRARPIENVIEELRTIEEPYLLFVDDNLVGTGSTHLGRAKDLFRAMIGAGIRKHWMAQVTINVADDDEVLALAARSGCFGFFIGFESVTPGGLDEVNKRFNAHGGRDVAEACRRIHRRGISICGSFMMGLDVDTPGVGTRIAAAGDTWGIDLLNLMLMTPLPGTRLWNAMAAANRIVADRFPGDWARYTFVKPVAAFRHLSWAQAGAEVRRYARRFYALRRVLRRACAALGRPHPLMGFFGTLVANLNFRTDVGLDLRAIEAMDLSPGRSLDDRAATAT